MPTWRGYHVIEDPAYVEDIYYRYQQVLKTGRDPYGLDRPLEAYERELMRVTGNQWRPAPRGSSSQSEDAPASASRPTTGQGKTPSTDAPPVVVVPGAPAIPSDWLWLGAAALAVLLLLRR